VRPAQADPPPLSPPEAAEPDVHLDPEAPENGDIDGARLIALNMALNGESREDADRYLAENFQLADRAELIAEVYAAIEP
jgi:HD superfamily phosphodiesterase